MESLTLEPTEAAGAETEDRALEVVRDVWRSGALTRGHELLAATRLVLGSDRLGRRPPAPPLPEAELERARAAGVAARARGGGGTVLPGKLLLSRNPRALAELGARLPLGVVLVSGTNGKTTTAAMIASVLAASGRAVVHNRAGANTHWGVATALVEQRGEVGVFEVDESWLPPPGRTGGAGAGCSRSPSRGSRGCPPSSSRARSCSGTSSATASTATA